MNGQMTTNKTDNLMINNGSVTIDNYLLSLDKFFTSTSIDEKILHFEMILEQTKSLSIINLIYKFPLSLKEYYLHWHPQSVKSFYQDYRIVLAGSRKNDGYFVCEFFESRLTPDYYFHSNSDDCNPPFDTPVINIDDGVFDGKCIVYISIFKFLEVYKSIKKRTILNKEAIIVLPISEYWYLISTGRFYDKESSFHIIDWTCSNKLLKWFDTFTSIHNDCMPSRSEPLYKYSCDNYYDYSTNVSGKEFVGKLKFDNNDYIFTSHHVNHEVHEVFKSLTQSENAPYISTFPFILDPQGREMEIIYSLSDTASKQTFMEIIVLKLTLLTKGINSYVEALVESSFSSIPDHQYFDPELLLPKESHTFIDVGAARGDTVEKYIKWAGHNYRGIIAIEPDSRSYLELQSCCGQWNDGRILTMKAKCGDNSGRVVPCRYLSRIDHTEYLNDLVEIVRLDEILAQQEPYFIKIDVEGDESRVISGAASTFHSLNGCAAICVYHRPYDFFDIPTKLLSLGNGKIFFRQYGEDIFSETVLYYLV